jgi:hypothetical protein
MMSDKQKKEIELLVMFYELFEDKNPKTADKVRNYCKYLTDLLNASAEDYIQDYKLEEN